MGGSLCLPRPRPHVTEGKKQKSPMWGHLTWDGGGEGIGVKVSSHHCLPLQVPDTVQVPEQLKLVVGANLRILKGRGLQGAVPALPVGTHLGGHSRSPGMPQLSHTWQLSVLLGTPVCLPTNGRAGSWEG